MSVQKPTIQKASVFKNSIKQVSGPKAKLGGDTAEDGVSKLSIREEISEIGRVNDCGLNK